MRVVALDTRLGQGVRMSLNCRHIFFFMAFETDLPSIFEQERRFIGLVRIMAGATFPVGRRIVLISGLGDLLLSLLMTFVTKFASGLHEEFLVVRLMRIMTGSTVAVL